MYSAAGSNSGGGASMNYYVPIPEAATPSNANNTSLERRAVRLFNRRYALTPTAYKYLEIGVSVSLKPPHESSFVELILGDNQGNKIAMSSWAWKTIIDRRTDFERLMRCAVGHAVKISALPSDNLLFKVVHIHDDKLIKLSSGNTSLYMTPATIMFFFELEQCVELVCSQLHEYAREVNKSLSNFGSLLRTYRITEKCDAVRFLHSHNYHDITNIVDCELIAYAMDAIMYAASREKSVDVVDLDE